MSSIVISYRRQDSADETRRVYDLFSTIFGKEQLFRDLDSIKPGTNFVETIDRVIGDASIVLAIIGPNWSSSQDKNGKRRLDNKNDYVRIEIARTLVKKKPLIPILVCGAEMPDEEEIPSELHSMLRIHAMHLRDDYFNSDLEQLSDHVKSILNKHSGAGTSQQSTELARDKGPLFALNRQRKLVIFAVVLLSIVAAAFAFKLIKQFVNQANLSLIAMPEVVWQSRLPPIDEISAEDPNPIIKDISQDCLKTWRSNDALQTWYEPDIFIQCKNDTLTALEDLTNHIDSYINVCEKNLKMLQQSDSVQPAQPIDLVVVPVNTRFEDYIESGLCYSGLPLQEVKKTSTAEDNVNEWIEKLSIRKDGAHKVIQAFNESEPVPLFPILMSNQGQRQLKVNDTATVWVNNVPHIKEPLMLDTDERKLRLTIGETRKFTFYVNREQVGSETFKLLMDSTRPLELSLSLDIGDTERRVQARFTPNYLTSQNPQK